MPDPELPNKKTKKGSTGTESNLSEASSRYYSAVEDQPNRFSFTDRKLSMALVHQSRKPGHMLVDSAIHESPRSMSPVDEAFERAPDSEAKHKERVLSQSSLFEDADATGWHEKHLRKTVDFVKDLLTNKEGRLYHIKCDEQKTEGEVLTQWRSFDRPALQRLDNVIGQKFGETFIEFGYTRYSVLLTNKGYEEAEKVAPYILVIRHKQNGTKLTCYAGMRSDFEGMYKDCTTLQMLADKIYDFIVKKKELPPGYDTLDDVQPPSGTRI